jgi:plasmid stability protein
MRAGITGPVGGGGGRRSAEGICSGAGQLDSAGAGCAAARSTEIDTSIAAKAKLDKPLRLNIRSRSYRRRRYSRQIADAHAYAKSCRKIGSVAVVIHESGEEAFLWRQPQSIRNLEEPLKVRLRIRAATHGRSMEDEARDILRTALNREPVRPTNLASAIRARFAPLGGVELPQTPREPMHEPLDFER